MAYSELIKNFNRIRDYMREFYVYGFKSRDEFTKKSARSYDDERRRVESWLGSYMQFRQTNEGKNVFLSIDSRITRHNPLYKAWKTKSFTDGDITLHFILFDILSDSSISLTIQEIMNHIDSYLSDFSQPKTFDESTVRKKLKEYVSQGLLLSEKKGKTVFYRRAPSTQIPSQDLLDYFSEVLPCGVIGSFILDRLDGHPSHFAFKHHYITSALDSEILYEVLGAIHDHRYLNIESTSRFRNQISSYEIIPLKIMVSVQNGRQHLMAYLPKYERITSFRLDNIITVSLGAICDDFTDYQEMLSRMLPHLWGVSTQSRSGERLEHIEFTIQYTEEESHIPKRLEREKRCGTVEYLNDHTCRFSADVFDASELIPWIRTFICRITEIHCSNHELEAQFSSDMNEMYALYDIGGES